MAFRVYHQVERYQAVKHALGAIRKNAEPCKILEIGAGRHGNLLDYFPQDDVLFTDIIYTPEDLQNPRFMNADATCLPFEDNSFDYVIGLDMLEHVSDQQRPVVMEQALRVARRAVFFSFPHLDNTHRSMSAELAGIYSQFGCEPPIWLYEHEEMGLPAFEDMRKAALKLLPAENIYTAHGIHYDLNRRMLRLEAYTSCNPGFTDLFINVSNTYSETLLQKDMGVPLEHAIKSYMILSKTPLDEHDCVALDQYFQQYAPEELKQFELTIAQQLHQSILESCTNAEAEEKEMEMKEMTTALLEVGNQLDRIIEKLDQMPASADVAESKKAVVVCMEQLMGKADAQAASQAELIQAVQQGNVSAQLDQMIEQINTQAVQQRTMLNAIKKADATSQISKLAEMLPAQQKEMLAAVRDADATPQINKLVEMMSTQCAAQTKLLDTIEAELLRRQQQRNRIVLNVILITYNQEKYIRTTLQSILDQKTKFPFNIIVADDCSKDKTVSIIKEMEKTTDIPFVYLDHTKNHGIMLNYKRAFAACDGDYVAIMEGDDIWNDPLRLQKHKDFLESHPECAMSFNQFVAKNFEKGEQNTQPAIIHAPNDTYRIFSGADLAYDNLIGNFSTSVYKNAYLQRLPKQLYEVHAYDWLTNIFIAQMGYIGCLLQPMSIYRIHSGGTWSQKKREEQLQEIIDATIVYDKLTNHEFTLGFQAHRQRLEAQLHALKALRNSSAPAAPVVTVSAESSPASVPVQKPRKTLRSVIKKIAMKVYSAAKTISGFLPPIVVTIVKLLIPSRLSQKLRNMREV